MTQKTPFLLLLIFSFSNFGCFIHSTKVRNLPKSEVHSVYHTTEGVKAHLYDGSLIIFRQGFKVVLNEGEKLLYANGEAEMYDLFRSDKVIRVSGVELAKVAALEIYPDKMDGDALLASIPTGVIGTMMIGVAIFGSCPTYYTTEGSELELQGEGFSYSVSKLSEKEDVDKIMGHHIADDGKFHLILRNEAMETHYINQLSLWQVNHAENQMAFPAIKKGIAPKEKQEIILMGKENLITSAKNQAGEEIFPLLKNQGDEWYQSPIKMTESIIDQPQRKDWIEFNIPNPDNAKKLFLGMKMRNTLLNSVFFYDVVLDEQDFAAIDWLTEDSDEIVSMLKFRKFYKEYFGMKIEIFENGKWNEVQYFSDQGPIAWSYRGFVIPTHNQKEMRVRLKFIPDNWMIDWLSASFEGNAKPNVAQILPKQIIPSASYPNSPQKESLTTSDNDYFITYPAQEYTLDFDLKKIPKEAETSLFIYSEGYYIEWLRNSWLENAKVNSTSKSLELNDQLIQKLYEQWLTKKEQFEEDFFNSKINPDN